MDSTTASYYSPWNDQTLFWFRGEKQYELDNHLGNVLVTVSDDKIGVPKTSNSSLIDHYVPVTINAQDYYPFGMLMQGRLVTSFYNYYFGFNGKEKDDEAKGSNNQIDYGARIYDPRVGRFLSVDPLTDKFHKLSPYQYTSNSPISGTDLDGKEFNYYGLQWKDKNTTQLKVGNLVRTDNSVTLRLIFKLGDVDGGALVDIPANFPRDLVGLSGNFVNYNGKAVKIPDEFDLQSLPGYENPVWETFQTDEEIDDNFAGAAKKILLSIQNVAYIKELASNGGLADFLEQKGLGQEVKNISSLRQKAVKEAWVEEKELVEKTGRGTRDWTEKEIEELRKTGKVKGYEGHHINNVADHPEQAGNSDNIEFLKRKEHFEKHSNNWKNPTEGDLIKRKEIINEFQQNGINDEIREGYNSND
jgi:RHS repeat-associated protein